MPSTPENTAPRYARLPGRGRRLSARLASGETQRLYLGGDHLLVLRQTGYEETSKRFFLGDIQAITVQSNSDRTIVSVVVLLMMMGFTAWILLALGPALDADPQSIGMWILYALLAITGLILIANLAQGPSCTVRLHTAVQIEEITALRRLRAARKCLATLVPRIEAAQSAGSSGPVTPQILVEQLLRASANAKSIAGKTAQKVVGRRVHAAAFALTIAFGLSGVLELLHRSPAKDIVDSLLLAVSVIALLIAAVRQSNSTLPRPARILTWSILVTNSITFFVVVYIVAFTVAFDAVNAGGSPDVTPDLTTILEQPPPWLNAFVAIWGALNVVLGTFGLLSIRGYSVLERAPLVGPGAAPR